jgi:hypothetical protein
MYWLVDIHPPANIKYIPKQQKQHKDKNIDQHKGREGTTIKMQH